MTHANLLEVTQQFGSPVYVYDSETIVNQYKRLTEAFKKVKHLRLHYAVKALSNLSILRLFNELGSSLDTVSIQEVKLGIAAGVDPKKIIFTPNGVSIGELEEALGLGVQINIDNLLILEEFGTKYPKSPCLYKNKPTCHGWRKL